MGKAGRYKICLEDESEKTDNDLLDFLWNVKYTVISKISNISIATSKILFQFTFLSLESPRGT